jgi:hypothetical protein
MSSARRSPAAISPESAFPECRTRSAGRCRPTRSYANSATGLRSTCGENPQCADCEHPRRVARGRSPIAIVRSALQAQGVLASTERRRARRCCQRRRRRAVTMSRTGSALTGCRFRTIRAAEKAVRLPRHRQTRNRVQNDRHRRICKRLALVAERASAGALAVLSPWTTRRRAHGVGVGARICKGRESRRRRAAQEFGQEYGQVCQTRGAGRRRL